MSLSQQFPKYVQNVFRRRNEFLRRLMNKKTSDDMWLFVKFINSYTSTEKHHAFILDTDNFYNLNGENEESIRIIFYVEIRDKSNTPLYINVLKGKCILINFKSIPLSSSINNNQNIISIIIKETDMMQMLSQVFIVDEKRWVNFSTT